jgi:hypothetical protein
MITDKLKIKRPVVMASYNTLSLFCTIGLKHRVRSLAITRSYMLKILVRLFLQ